MSLHGEMASEILFWYLGRHTEKGRTAGVLFWKSTAEVLPVILVNWQPARLCKSWVWLQSGDTMSAVTGTLYSPLLSFRTHSPWNNSNTGPPGWPTRWVTSREISFSARYHWSIFFGHLAVLLRNEDLSPAASKSHCVLNDQCNAETCQFTVLLLTCRNAFDNFRKAFSN